MDSFDGEYANCYVRHPHLKLVLILLPASTGILVITSAINHGRRYPIDWSSSIQELGQFCSKVSSKMSKYSVGSSKSIRLSMLLNISSMVYPQWYGTR